MSVEMVLNDLSLVSPVSEQGVARQLMTELIQVLTTARKEYDIKTLYMEDTFYNLILSPDYPVASWLKDGKVEREERSFIQSRQINTPLLGEITDETITNETDVTDFKFEDQSSYTLGMAYLLNALVVSFNSDSKWNCDSLNLEITRLEERSSSESGIPEHILTTTTERLIHASRREHILGHKIEIENRYRTQLWHPEDKLLPCYTTTNGKKPLAEWINSLSDQLTKTVIQARLNQVKQGKLGDYKSVGEGVCELRIDYGTGYRIYFTQSTSPQLLLHGGNKSTQAQDIIKAKEYWQEYKKR